MQNRFASGLVLAIVTAALAATPTAVTPAAQPARPGTLVRLGPHVLGRDSAPITIIEFTDLQCPFCVRFTATTFPELKARFIDTGVVRFTSRDFPLAFHGYAVPASRATRCAGEQGKFWDLRWLLSRNAAKLSDEVVMSGVKSLGLALAPFRTCFESDRFEKDIRQDQADAAAAGVTGTPTFLIGRSEKAGITSGFRVVGAKPIEEFEGIIRKLQEPAR